MSDTKKLAVVTGGAGFVGTHLCRRLRDDGYRVISLDNYFTGSRDNHVDGVEYREGHTKDIATHIPEDPDIIYHLGEYSRVEQSVLEPDVVHDLNVLGTRGVVYFWKIKKCKLVYAGSSTKFGDDGKARTTSPYAQTKAQNTELVKSVGDAEGLPYAITYFYNVYGPGERAGLYGTLIESFKQIYLSGAPFPVTAPGTQTRNFTHVDDIVDGLIIVGERGQGDEYGLGHEKTFTILEIAGLFGGSVVLFPPRTSNRMSSTLDASKSFTIGWKPSRDLEEYIREFCATHPRGNTLEKRVLVFSTTFYPIEGPAESALTGLMEALPDVQFDIVTTRFSRHAQDFESPVSNAYIHRVGFGHPIDKYLLPFLGFWAARRLHVRHRYPFAWSIMASYAALAGILLRGVSHLPLLITLADQDLTNLPPVTRFILRRILTDADQVYGVHTAHERVVAQLTAATLKRHSIGGGDAFANQLRYAYAEILLQR